jgi:hypothetical protein
MFIPKYKVPLVPYAEIPGLRSAFFGPPGEQKPIPNITQPKHKIKTE